MADTRKVVINKCFGGFGLSAKALARLAELQGRACYFYANVGASISKYERISIDQAEDAWLIFAFDAPDAIDTFLGQHDDWHSLTQAEKAARNDAYRAHQIDASDMARDDPNLVRVVEELGKAANGKHASLSIVEIPDDVAYEISEYDGNEHIAETHRTWY